MVKVEDCRAALNNFKAVVLGALSDIAPDYLVLESNNEWYFVLPVGDNQTRLVGPFKDSRTAIVVFAFMMAQHDDYFRYKLGKVLIEHDFVPKNEEGDRT